MVVTVLRAKLHSATVTQADLNYQGSIAIDGQLLRDSGILPFEQVQVYNVTNGERFVTYAIEAPAASRTICVNGAAARRVAVGDRVIIVAYGQLGLNEARLHTPKVIVLGKDNRIES